MLEVVKLTKVQWTKIKPYVIISSYGTDKTIFKSIDDILTANKVVTLNGKAMWGKRSATRSIAERIADYHSIFELPDGTFAVASQEFKKDINSKKVINICADQKWHYDTNKL